MLTIPDKILISSLILTASGVLLAGILGASGTDVEELPDIVGLFAVLTLLVAPIVALISAIVIVFTL